MRLAELLKSHWFCNAFAIACLRSGVVLKPGLRKAELACSTNTAKPMAFQHFCVFGSLGYSEAVEIAQLGPSVPN